MRLFFILLTLPLYVFAQKNIIIIDSITKNPIEYATVLFNNSGVYSDSKGSIELPNDISKIKVSSIGYKNKEIHHLKDTIFLVEKIEYLKEVIITVIPKTKRVINKKKSKLYVNASSKSEAGYFSKLFSLAKTSKIENAHFDILNDSKERLCRLLIYEVKNTLPHKNIIHQNIIRKISANSENFEIDLKENDIVLDKGDYHLVLEVFDIKINNSSFKIGCYKTHSKNNSMVKGVFDKSEWESIKTLNKRKVFAFNFFLTIKD